MQKINSAGVPMIALESGGVALTNINISAGTTSNNLSNLVFSNSNSVSFGLNGSTITASIAAPQGSINISAGTTSNLSSAFTFSNLNGVTFGLDAGTITASVAPSAGSLNISAGTTSNNLTNLVFSNSNNISFGLNGSTITASGSLSQSNQIITVLLGIANSITDAGYVSSRTFNASSLLLGALVGARIGIRTSGGVERIEISASQDFHARFIGNTTISSVGTFSFSQFHVSGAGNITVGADNFLGSNTWFISGSQSNQQITLFATSNTTQSSTGTTNASSIIFAGAGGVSVGISNGSVVISGANAGGGFTLSTYEPFPAFGASTGNGAFLAAASSAPSMSIFPFYLYQNVSVGIMDILCSMNFTTVGTSSGRQTAGLAIAIYTRNVSTLSSLVSASFSWQVTGQNSSYTINQPRTTNYTGYVTGATNSAGSNITSGYTGGKLIGFPINSLLTPGNYWLGILGTNSTSSVNVGIISLSYKGAILNTGATGIAPMGSFSTSFSTGPDPRGGPWYVGHGSFTSVGLSMVPASVNMNVISAGITNVPIFKFWST